MFTGVFRDRTRLQRLATHTAHQALRELIFSPALASHRVARQCEIGPFVVEYFFRERALIVELEPPEAAALPRAQARAALLKDLGYTVLMLPRREVRLHPRQALGRIKAALANKPGGMVRNQD